VEGIPGWLVSHPTHFRLVEGAVVREHFDRGRVERHSSHLVRLGVLLAAVDPVAPDLHCAALKVDTCPTHGQQLRTADTRDHDEPHEGARLSMPILAHMRA